MTKLEVEIDFEKLGEELAKYGFANVVRCKDCKYWTEHIDFDDGTTYWRCTEWDRGIDPNGYCYTGERKDNATD